MFVLINPVEQRRKIRRIIYPQRVEMGDKYYYSQKLPIIKGIPQWQGLVTSEKLLLPRDLKAPSEIKVFGGYEWQLVLTAEKLKQRLMREKCDLIFFDKEGRHSGLLSRLAQYARNTAVISGNINFYLKQTEEIYRRLGCYVCINTTIGLQVGYAFITDMDESVNIKSGFRAVTVNYLGEADIKLPHEYSRYFPKAVSKCGLSEALYSACGIGRLRDYVHESKNDL